MAGCASLPISDVGSVIAVFTLHDGRASRQNARWSLDFVYDQFANGRLFRVLNIVADVTKEYLSARPNTSISGR
jgi:hypothetical protein